MLGKKRILRVPEWDKWRWVGVGGRRREIWNSEGQMKGEMIDRRHGLSNDWNLSLFIEIHPLSNQCRSHFPPLMWPLSEIPSSLFDFPHTHRLTPFKQIKNGGRRAEYGTKLNILINRVWMGTSHFGRRRRLGSRERGSQTLGTSPLKLDQRQLADFIEIFKNSLWIHLYDCQNVVSSNQTPRKVHDFRGEGQHQTQIKSTKNGQLFERDRSTEFSEKTHTVFRIERWFL